MKKLLLICWSALFFAVVGQAKPRTVAPKLPDVGQQLASYITCPAVLKPLANGSVVVIQFRVNEDNRLAKLEVWSNNAELNNDLTRQLIGKKIRLADPNPFETHTVRLHFTP